MYEIKGKIFLEFSKTQKTALCNFLRALVKKLQDLSVDEILAKFIDDQKYYLEINSSRFSFLKESIDDEIFLSDCKLYLNECKKYYEYKKSQAPIVQAKKEFERKKRKFFQNIKMSKEKPTKKQLYYYDKLCKNYGLNKKESADFSKLDLKNMIDGILNEHKAD